jgi:LmbE family N-acetylglucosaminyl deacetylase
MRAQDALQAMRRWPVLDFGTAFGPAPVCVLAPHPDDESLGCGGLIAEACDRGTPPVVVILTDGTGSHPNSRSYPAERLRGLRESEVLAATARLGLAEDRVVFLRYRDTAAPSQGAALQAAADRLMRIIDDRGCAVLVAPWRHDPHCDHEAAALIAQAAGRAINRRVLAYPVWGLALPADAEVAEDRLAGFRLRVADQLGKKRAAILEHASQYAGVIDDDPDGFQMAPGFVELFMGDHEVFIEVG